MTSGRGNSQFVSSAYVAAERQAGWVTHYCAHMINNGLSQSVVGCASSCLVTGYRSTETSGSVQHRNKSSAAHGALPLFLLVELSVTAVEKMASVTKTQTASGTKACGVSPVKSSLRFCCRREVFWRLMYLDYGTLKRYHFCHVTGALLRRRWPLLLFDEWTACLEAFRTEV